MFSILRTLSLLLSFFLFFHVLNAQSIPVSGKVTDTKGSPLPSVSIKVKNSNEGVTTDDQGKFLINVNPNAILMISTVGYYDTSIFVEGRSIIPVVLRQKTGLLNEVIVPGNQDNGMPSVNETMKEAVIVDVFQDYLKSVEFTNGILEINKYNVVTNKIVLIHVNGFGPLNSFNAGEMLPQVDHKEETHGSRYLLNRYARGLIVDADNHILTDSANLLNYDKINGQLMIARDDKNYLEVDKDKVIAFALKTEDTAYIFLKVPILSKVNYFMLIANGPKYSVYKSVRTQFVKSNYITNGLTESGNNYDEYVDKQTYFWVDQIHNQAGTFELKKKSIRELFPEEKSKVETFFTDHKHDETNDSFLKKMVTYLNN